jgi:hypothetical protein
LRRGIPGIALLAAEQTWLEQTWLGSTLYSKKETPVGKQVEKR